MRYEDNPYYFPGRYGCCKVGEVERSEETYGFDTIAVLASTADDGGFYVGTDSGCSCPTPFEHYAGLDDFTGPLTADQCAEEVISLWLEPYDPYDLPALADLLCGILDVKELPGELAARIINGIRKKKREMFQRIMRADETGEDVE